MASRIHPNAASFKKAMRHHAKVRIPGLAVDHTRLIALLVFREIILRSVVDKGFYRAGHNVSVNRRDFSQPLTPVAPDEGILRGLSDLKLGDTIFITNALPYAEVIEHGLYPDPVTLGTYLRRGQIKGSHRGPGYFVFSERGFSRQAPKGVYRQSVQAALAKLRAAGALA